MRAARLHAYGQPLVIDDIPTPEPGPGEVLLRVEGAGFCHSDIHVMDGEIQILPHMPLTLGHENAGVVAEVGRGVTAVREGESVAVFGGWGCGLCAYCVTGHEQLCETPQWAGLSKYDGGYADYLLVPNERYLVKLTTLHPTEAAPLTDAALTPYRAIKKALPFLEPDHCALLIGVGGLGQYGLKLLNLMAACPVIVVDKSDDKLGIARQLGATHTINALDPDLAGKIRELTQGHGVNASFDFVGTEGTLALAISQTRALGKVSQLGLAGGAARLKPLENSRFEVLFEATLWGTIKELREVIALAESGRLSLTETELAPLEQINDVYGRLKRGEIAGRAVIAPLTA
ncbi:MAG TPA: NAD(P)-dependent alcohol dehydrogenase [Vicinamibacterales bacterium]|nr:NAD(P)-dependent alcohol dehydrogenase [Vicinamibacterales bacterium]